MHSIIEMWTLRKKKKFFFTLKFLETESRKAVASGWGVGRQGEFGEKIQTFTYKVNII